MARGVLVVSGMELGGRRLNTCMIDEAFGHQVPGGTYPLECSAADPVFTKLRAKPPAVRQAGERLYSALVAHQPVRDFFALAAPAAGPPAPADVFPLYVRVDTPDAEDFPWEALWENQKAFMALDPQGRWPIARLTAATARSQPLQRWIGTEMRAAVVLAAAGENGVDEWRPISAALSQMKMPSDVLALVSEDSAETAIRSDFTAWQGQAPARTGAVDFVGDAASLITRLRAQQPNVIHFFCHGVADTRPELELESRTDRRARRQTGSITLGSETLIQLGQFKSLWLVVLNCCQGGKAAPQLHSLAKDLVTAGVPAVVAMRESVDVSDANLFAAHFYPSLLTQLQALFTARAALPPGAAQQLPEVMWARAVHEARRQLSSNRGRKPDSSAEWTYPVVYVHRDQLTLSLKDLKTVAALPPETRQLLLTQLDVLRDFRSAIDYAGGDDAPGQRATLDAQIQAIENQLAGG